MTVKLLTDFSPYKANAIVTIDPATEAGLVASGQATTDLAGGDAAIESPLVPLNVPALMAAMALVNKPHVNVCLLGDSISTRDQPQVAAGLNGPRADGIGTMLEMLSGGRARLVAARAAAGFTIAQIAGLVPQVLADKPDICIVLAGTNDAYSAPTPDPADVIFARLRDTVWTPLLNAGIVVLAVVIPPSATRSSTVTATQHATARQLVRLIRRAETQYPHLLVSDMHTVMESATGANEGANINLYVATDATYLHPNDSGSIVTGAEHWRILQQRGLTTRRPEVQSLDSPYSVGLNPRGMGNNASGTNKASLGAGVTGTGPDGWNINRSGTSTAVITPGAVARTDGRDGQLVQVAATIAADSEGISVLPGLNGVMFLTGASSAAVRTNAAAYVPGEVRRFSNGLFYKVLKAGTSAGAEPGSLPTTLGSLLTTDNTVVWMRVPDLVPGRWLRLVAEFFLTAHATANIFPQVYLKQYSTGQANLAAGVVFESNGQQNVAGSAAGSWGTVVKPSVTGFNGYRPGTLPLNQVLRLESPWCQIAPDCAIVEPCLRLIGAAGATATLQISHLDVHVRPT